MQDSSDSEAIPEAAREVIALYRARADTLRFPDMNLDVLVAVAEALVETRQRVAAIAEQLEQERAEAQTSEEALMLASRRAVAYARVFAETDPALSDAVSDLLLSKASDRPKPTRNGRRRKKPAPPAPLTTPQDTAPPPATMQAAPDHQADSSVPALPA